MSTSLFFPSGERRRDLCKQASSETSKRLQVDAPIFYSQGMDEGVAAMEPAAGEALMGLATGDLIFYGNYFEKNRLLRELTFEREARFRFGHQLENQLRFGGERERSRQIGGGRADDEYDDL